MRCYHNAVTMVLLAFTLGVFFALLFPAILLVWCLGILYLIAAIIFFLFRWGEIMKIVVLKSPKFLSGIFKSVFKMN